MRSLTTTTTPLQELFRRTFWHIFLHFWSVCDMNCEKSFVIAMGKIIIILKKNNNNKEEKL